MESNRNAQTSMKSLLLKAIKRQTSQLCLMSSFFHFGLKKGVEMLLSYCNTPSPKAAITHYTKLYSKLKMFSGTLELYHI